MHAALLYIQVEGGGGAFTCGVRCYGEHQASIPERVTQCHGRPELLEYLLATYYSLMRRDGR